MQRIRRAAALAAAMVAAAPAVAQACEPRRIGLPPPEGHDMAGVLAFGQRGLVGGTAARLDAAFGDQVAVLWRGSRVEAVLGRGYVADINDRDEVLVNDPDWATFTGEAWILRAGVRRDLPGLGGGFVWARRLNDRGDAVGSATDADGREHPVVWRAGGAPRPLPLPDGADGGDARGVNERGDVVGNVWGEGIALSQAWVWFADGSNRALDPAPWSATDPGASFVHVIDGRRRAAGIAGGVHEPDAFAAIWADGGRRLAGQPGGFTELLGTSGQGDFAGTALSPDGVWQTVLAREDGPLLRLLPLSGDPADDASAHPVSRSDRGDVRVGGSSINADGVDQATVWTCAYRQAVTLDGAAPAGARRHGRASRMVALSPDRRSQGR